ncbi:MAG: tRNA (N6-isopentenyl adenosine(37)-C2)-methylthiotransferase MiaB [Eggerthellales bacterium]|nr:tRNA (N6-isopentenyl adenosine(37)-C2)-methylthiotransferase MiaB [Eggerthellales bacterium]
MLANKTFYLFIYGCQMNEHDAERIVGLLETYGAMRVDSVEAAEIVVFVTCCVREAADIRLMGQAASIKNIPLPADSTLNKRIVAVGGCIGQRDGLELLEKLDNVDVVFGTHTIDQLPGLLIKAASDHSRSVSLLEESAGFASDLPSHRKHTWAAWLPITTGCDNFCTYCIVPYVRGREKSRTLEDVLDEASLLVSEGVKEITLLGQNVNSYGRDLYGSPQFAKVLKGVCDTGVDRVRFATSHPKDLTDEVIALFGTEANLMPYLHLPAQSGSNRILREMNRRYTREAYLDLVRKVRQANPDISLSTDIIVGFPGETEEDFQQTYNLVKEVGYSQVFTFIYSKREGTPAAEMPDDTPREVIQDRFDRLVALVQENAYQQNQRFVGRWLDVLVEGPSKRDPRVFTGHSPHNVTVHAKVPSGVALEDIVGTMVQVRIDEAKTWYLTGEVVGE